MILRRLLLIALVLASASQIPGCATLDVQCQIRQDYRTSAVPPRGSVNVTWEVTDKLPPNTHGYATCDRERKNCHIQIARKPDFNDVCRVHDFGHEMLHALGAQH